MKRDDLMNVAHSVPEQMYERTGRGYDADCDEGDNIVKPFNRMSVHELARSQSELGGAQIGRLG